MDVIINYIINEAWKCRCHFGNPLFQLIKSPLMQHDVTQCLPLNGTIDAVGASRMRSVCAAAATDHGLAILSIGHTVSLFSCKTEDSADQHVRKMFILFLLPSMSNSFHRACTETSQTPQSIYFSLRVMSWYGHTPQEHHLAGDDVMHCYCRGYYWGFHIKLYNPLSFILSLCALSKKTKQKIIVFLFTSRKGSCDFIKGGEGGWEGNG